MVTGNFSDYETRKKVVDMVEDALSNRWGAFLPELKKYTTHKSEDLRRDIYALLWKFGKNSKDVSKRRTIVEHMVEGVKNDTPFIKGQLLKWLQDFNTNDFNEKSVNILKELPYTDDGSYSLIKVIGIAEIKATLPTLRELAKNEIKEPGSGRWYGTNEWAALLVLARLKEKNTIFRVIEKVENEPDKITRVTVLLKDLGYTKHSEAFDVLRKYLNSNERLPAVDSNVLGPLPVFYVIPLFAEYLENFPFKEKIELRQAREWANSQKEWKIKK